MLTRTCSVLIVISASSLFVIQAGADCKTGPRECENNKEVSFGRDVLPPLQKSCESCHHSEQTFPSLNLTTHAAYRNIVSRKSTFIDEFLVKPGEPDRSLLVEKIARKPRFGQQMPPYGRPVSPRELKLLIDWIRQGAKNN